MSKKQGHLSWLKGHRDWKYQESIGKVLDGRMPPEYMTKRWDKVKELPKR